MKLLSIYKTITATLIWITYCTVTQAQYSDPYSYVTMPLTYSPAATGLINGDIRANVLRNWESISYSSQTMGSINASIDMPILRNVLPKGNAIGIGVIYSVANDFISGLMPYGMNIYSGINTAKTMGVSAAYHKALDKEMNHHLSLGIQFFNINGEITDKPLILSRWSSNSTNVGLLYSGKVSQKLFLYSGISIKQNSIGIRSVNGGMLETSFGGNWEISKRIALFGNFTQIFIAGFYRVQAIAYTRITLNNPSNATKNRFSLLTGFGYSVDDALLPYVALEYRGIRIGGTTNLLWHIKNQTTAAAFNVQYVGHLPIQKKTSSKSSWNVVDMF